MGQKLMDLLTLEYNYATRIFLNFSICLPIVLYFRQKRLAEVLHNEPMMRVINPSLAECSSEAMLRSSQFQDKFEMRAELELRPTLSTLGFTILKAFITSNQTDNERIAQLKSELAAATIQKALMLKLDGKNCHSRSGNAT